MTCRTNPQPNWKLPSDIEEINQKVRANLEKSWAEDCAARYARLTDKLTEAITRKRADRMASC